MMKAFSRALFLVSFLALCAVPLLTGCGQKGPLFLPGHAPESQTEGPFGLDDDNDEQSRAPRPAGAAGDDTSAETTP